LLYADGCVRPLAVRYRKGIALLAYLAARGGRPLPRHAAAQMLWPDRSESSARANLRVVINDLGKRLGALGLAEYFEVQPQWLSFHSDARLITDERLLVDPAARALFAAALAERIDLTWCDLEGEGIDWEADFDRWLRAHRQWLAERGRAPVPTVENTEVRESQGGGAGQWQRLAIVRLALIDDGPDERADLLDRHRRFAELGEALRLYGATLAASDAEGVSFVFGLRARSGGFCRLALRAALSCSEKMPAASIGLTVGPLFVAPQADASFQGRRLLEAVELARAAGAGEIAVDASFPELPVQLAHRVEQRCLRPAAAAAPLRIYTPASLRQVLAVPLLPETPFVGRAADLERVQASLATSAAPVILVGPPGIGKTRLALEVARSSPHGLAVWIFCRAESAQVPWSSLVELFTRLEPEGLPERERRAVRQLLDERYLGIEQRGGLLSALARLFAAALPIVDDAQWMDAATARLLDEFARTARRSWLLTRRPQPGGWLPQGALRYELAALDDAAGQCLLADLGHAATSAEQRQGMLARARGLPLLLIAEANRDAAEFADALSGWCNLAEVDGDALGAAAVLGQQFRRDDLGALIGAEAAEATLTAAASEGLMFAYHRDGWGFVHPLLREQCRARLDRASEVRLAQLAAERLLARQETAHAAELFEEAGVKDRAALCWLAAAMAALKAEDACAACALFDRLARVGYPAGTTGDWARLHHARALIVRDGYGIDEIVTLCADVAHRHTEPVDAAEHELRFAAEALLYLWSGGDSVTRGLAQAQRLCHLAQTPEQDFAGRWARANTSFFRGDFMTAKSDFEFLLASDIDHAGRTRYFPSDPFAFLATNHAWLLWFLGEPGWREEIENHVARTRGEPTRQAECIARVFAAAIYLAQGEQQAMAEHAARALDIAQNEAFAFWEAYATMMVLIVRGQAGTPPDAAACDAIEAAVTRGYPAGVNTARWLLAEAWVAARCWPQAHALTERTLKSALLSEHLYCLPDIYRLHAFALAGLGEKAAADAAMAEAHQLARARSWRGWLARWDAVPLLTG